ncbi:glutaredoxin family protein [Jeotgalibacillus campisalis]|uniref:Glutaredoxin n=1 Tax=Jeotgalibacillus campisalis TaxID=220754 RepID=A0A0C2S0H4_9BACL|nr:glutaredoxin domain-containing protein [Jeotgalibacillus campisalis]KIL47534.1 glutaredoxin [Jeotgalibacillus campisalis]
MHKVVLYTQPQCPPCEIVKKFLQAHYIQFKEVNIKVDQKAKSYMLTQLEAYSTPTVVVNEQQVIRGFNLEELASALDISCE